MADVPDRYLEAFADGEFPAASARDWLRENPDDAAEIERFQDAGLSMEWAFAAADADLPHPSEWDHVGIHRDADGGWDISISWGDETRIIEAANSDDIAADNIWADFWFHVIDEYDIDVDKDIDYGED